MSLYQSSHKTGVSQKRIAVGSIPGKGRGVFAGQAVHKGDLIEKAPVIVLPDPQWKLIEATRLKDYYLYWTKDSVAEPMGLGMLYNYSEQPNAIFVRDYREALLEVRALRDIRAGEEILVRYHCPSWFKVIEGSNQPEKRI